MHEVCDIGGNANQDFVLHFPRDDNGKVDVVNGKYSADKKLLKVKFKYDKEV